MIEQLERNTNELLNILVIDELWGNMILSSQK